VVHVSGDNYLYQFADSPFFYPCEARALFGAERGGGLLARLFAEIGAIPYVPMRGGTVPVFRDRAALEL
jgi:hypothetical protein